MGATRRRMSARPGEVYAVLCDGHNYGDWVVGTRTIRHVEGPWPEAGAKLHYTVGYGPLRTDDETQALAVTPRSALGDAGPCLAGRDGADRVGDRTGGGGIGGDH